MKTDSLSLPSVPSLFQIAAFFEDFFPVQGLRRPASPVHQLPIAKVMVNPDKLLKLLISGRVENQAALGETNQATPKRGARASSPKKTAPPNPGKPGVPPSPTGETKNVEFTLKSFAANSVKLAGDFTEWEKSPLDMKRLDGGVWSATVPLKPGEYSYRFIVDGSWCDDPGSVRKIPNPFGSQNAVVQVR